MLPPDPKQFFVGDVKHDFVTGARGTEPGIPAPAPPIPPDDHFHITVGSLTLDVDRTVPPTERAFSHDLARQARERIDETVRVFMELTPGRQLLEELAHLHEHLVFGKQTDAEDRQLDLSAVRHLARPIKRINILFMSEANRNEEEWKQSVATIKAELEGKGMNELQAHEELWRRLREKLINTRLFPHGTVGEFYPDRLDTEYWVFIRLHGTNDGPGPKFWPCPEEPHRSIAYMHRTPVARMVRTFAHELLHVWYVYKFWFLMHQEPGRDGHATYEHLKAWEGIVPAGRCDPDFFDPVDLAAVANPHEVGSQVPSLFLEQPVVPRIVRPFRARLQQFCAAIDAHAVAQPTP